VIAVLMGLAAAIVPSCSFGEYISVCNFAPSKMGSFRIVSEARATAKGPAPHTLTSEYVVNGMHCRQSETWRSGTQITRANCVAQLNVGTYYHVVATTNAQNADHIGRLSISIAPTDAPPTLHAAPASIQIKTSDDISMDRTAVEKASIIILAREDGSRLLPRLKHRQ
jgi:hypothetical protein